MDILQCIIDMIRINNIKCAIMKTKDKETIKTLKKCLKREISELNDNQQNNFI